MSTTLHFDTPFPFGKSIHVLRELTTELLGEDHELVRCVTNGDWDSALSLTARAGEDVCGRDFWRLAQALAFFSKNASLPLGYNTSEVALKKFLESEEKCRQTNNRYRNRSKPFTQGGLDAGLIFSVQRKIAEILGPFPGLDAFNFDFGPGANVGVSRFTSLRRKFSATPTCSTAAYKYVKYLKAVSPHWKWLDECQVADSGRYTTVPKNAKTDRSILVEPLINAHLQTGVGSFLKARLRKFGVNLKDQSINQEWARKGSIDGSIATLDLAAASDTISREVVAELLPFEWWLFLNDIRSQYATLPDGSQIYLEKFSSMGNGFTFELESLIFFAILCVVTGRNSQVSVYGDDLIVPTHMADKVIKALNEFGFEVNSSKSFVDGPFRESCGRDYLRGVLVRPCFVKGPLSVKEIFRLHNFFIRVGEEGLAGLLLKHVPVRYRLFGPDGYGDGHLLGDHSRFRPRSHVKRGFGGSCFRTYAQQPLERREALRGDHLSVLFSLGRRDSERWSPMPVSLQEAALLAKEIDDVHLSETMFHERGGTRYRLQRIYTLEPLEAAPGSVI